LFLIIFLETGLVITPFLPGDSLLFAAATLAATGSLNLTALTVLLITAAILGDATNYFIGNKLGHRLIHTRWVKKESLDKTHRFYEKHGGKTIIIARFVPIVRTFAPFVAGIGAMSYRRFASFNIIGGILWVLSFLMAGYFFGNLPFVRQNFGIVIIAIIIISVLPAVIGWFNARKPNNNI
jgi:membrane-associated protein